MLINWENGRGQDFGASNSVCCLQSKVLLARCICFLSLIRKKEMHFRFAICNVPSARGYFSGVLFQYGILNSRGPVSSSSLRQKLQQNSKPPWLNGTQKPWQRIHFHSSVFAVKAGSRGRREKFAKREIRAHLFCLFPPLCRKDANLCAVLHGIRLSCPIFEHIPLLYLLLLECLKARYLKYIYSLFRVPVPSCPEATVPSQRFPMEELMF